MEYNQFLKEFKSFGNPYKILGIDFENDTITEKIIKKQYNKLSLIHHPDRGGQKEIFHQIKKASELLLKHDDFKNHLDSYLKNIKQRQKEFENLEDKRKDILDDLVAQEDLWEKKQKQEEKKKMEELIKQQKYREELDKEYQEYKQRKEQMGKKEEKAEENKNKEFAKLAQIKIKWGPNQMYTENLLKIIFQSYGKINQIMVIQEKNTAVIEYSQIPSAEKAVKAYKKEDEDGKQNENNTIQGDDLEVKYVVKKKERKKLLEKLQNVNESSKNNQNQKNSDPFDLSSESLNKIQSTINKQSQHFQKTMTQREKDKQEYLKNLQKTQI
ncbi:DnaJ domain [Pseudocohnilembus persalinus]|uniref:DnaJ domain n=1 Tax=Pseudocohnilembus persalinus TaxID=266149 RepID=A0A0V0Q8P4_PSEPJ|nr:DnaJ domain [Pseudocohnilembus persalinus]|eukprot:KRW98391.1 DnaJ domain [Pseudocohnilembus persalinus]